MQTTEMNPIQPYFVLGTDTPYFKHSSGQNGIAHFYEFSHKKESKMQIVVPDASVDIIFNLNENNPTSWIYGSVSKPQVVPFAKGEKYFGVRYEIGDVPTFLDLKPQNLIDNSLLLTDVFPRALELQEKLVKCNNFEHQVQLFNHICHKSLIQKKEAPELCKILIHILLSQQGNIRISELAEKTGYSTRLIDRVFKDYYGISPKKFSLILKNQHALWRLTRYQYKRLTDLALDLGYTDQSHFLKEFKRHNILGPKQFNKMMGHYRYQDLILDESLI